MVKAVPKVLCDCSLDQTALIALRCLGLLFIETKTMKADEDNPFLMNFALVGMHKLLLHA